LYYVYIYIRKILEQFVSIGWKCRRWIDYMRHYYKINCVCYAGSWQ